MEVPDPVMTATIEDLSPELLVEIFSHYIKSRGHMNFSRIVAPVCTTWWRLSKTPSLWQDLRIRNWNYALSLANRGLLKHTKSLLIDKWIRDKTYRRFLVPNDLLLAILSKIRDLKRLEITRVNINTQTMMIVVNHCPNLEHLSMSFLNSDDAKIHLQDMVAIINVCGTKLKHLSFLDCVRQEEREQLIEEIAVRCPSLEEGIFHCWDSRFPIYKLANGCPRLRKLEFSDCVLVATAENYYPVFKSLKSLYATESDFRGLDMSALLNNSENLERLELSDNENVIYGDISKIPSNKISFIRMDPKDNINLVGLEQAVDKWKHTLEHLEISSLQCDITNTLKLFLDGNQYPKLKKLLFAKSYVDRSVLNMFISKCQNLENLSVKIRGEAEYKYFEEHEEIMEFMDSL